jgi:hypothetical protein
LVLSVYVAVVRLGKVYACVTVVCGFDDAAELEPVELLAGAGLIVYPVCAVSPTVSVEVSMANVIAPAAPLLAKLLVHVITAA